MNELPLWMQGIGIWSGLAISVVAVLGGLFGVINFIVNAAIDRKISPELATLKANQSSIIQRMESTDQKLERIQLLLEEKQLRKIKR